MRRRSGGGVFEAIVSWRCLALVAIVSAASLSFTATAMARASASRSRRRVTSHLQRTPRARRFELGLADPQGYFGRLGTFGYRRFLRGIAFRAIVNRAERHREDYLGEGRSASPFRSSPEGDGSYALCSRSDRRDVVVDSEHRGLPSRFHVQGYEDASLRRVQFTQPKVGIVKCAAGSPGDIPRLRAGRDSPGYRGRGSLDATAPPASPRRSRLPVPLPAPAPRVVARQGSRGLCSTAMTGAAACQLTKARGGAWPRPSGGARRWARRGCRGTLPCSRR